MGTNPLTPAERAEMRKRCEAATPGPWERCFSSVIDWKHDLKTFTIEFQCNGESVGKQQRYTDLDFIAAARTDVPRLLDALDAAEARIRELEKVLGTQLAMGQFHSTGVPMQVPAAFVKGAEGGKGVGGE